MCKYFVVLGLLVLSCQSPEKEPCDYIEDYYQTVYKAELAYWEEDYDKSLSLLRKAESNCTLLNQPGTYEPMLMANLLIRKGRETEAFVYVEKMLEDGYTLDMFNIPIFDEIKTDAHWASLKSQEVDYILKFREGINYDLQKEIIAMNELDQKVRQQPIDWDKLNKVDSIHQARIKEIVKTYGYPDSRLVGNSSMSHRTSLRTIFFHLDDTTYFKPVLLEFIKKGKAPASILGTMLDSQQRSRGYFDYGIYGNADSTVIRDFKNLDKRRIAIGLPPWKLRKRVDSLKKDYYNIP